MSMQSVGTQVCQYCGKKYDFEKHNSINVTLTPNIKPFVLDKSLFVSTCPDCGKSNFLVYDTVYHDMNPDNPYMIHCVYNPVMIDMFLNTVYNREKSGIDLVKMSNYKFRVVDSVDQLVEKILMFDAGFDDRIIDIYKVLLVGSVFVMEDTEMARSNQLDIFFDVNSEGKNWFVIFGDKELIGEVEFSQEMYDDLLRRFGSVLGDIKDLKYVYVNEEHLLSFLHEHEDLLFDSKK